MTDNKKIEALIDISYYAGYMKFTTGDSRTDVSLFEEWADLFVKLFKNVIGIR